MVDLGAQDNCSNRRQWGSKFTTTRPLVGMLTTELLRLLYYLLVVRLYFTLPQLWGWPISRKWVPNQSHVNKYQIIIIFLVLSGKEWQWEGKWSACFICSGLECESLTVDTPKEVLLLDYLNHDFGKILTFLYLLLLYCFRSPCFTASKPSLPNMPCVLIIRIQIFKGTIQKLVYIFACYTL